MPLLRWIFAAVLLLFAVAIVCSLLHMPGTIFEVTAALVVIGFIALVIFGAGAGAPRGRWRW